MELLHCKDIAFSYDSLTVLRGISFAVNAGETLCIVGENGSGKTTLLRGLLGLLKPSGGSIERRLYAGGIGYLPQESSLQKDFPATVYEAVLSGRQSCRGLWPFYTKADKAAVNANLERTGLAGLSGRCFRELSGGQRRRALLARALCAAGIGEAKTTKNPGILILDEPASGLDPLVQRDLYAVLRSVNSELAITIIMVSHELEGVLELADKILHIGEHAGGGTTLFYGSCADYRASEAGRRFLHQRKFSGIKQEAV
ncbi:MAG: ATP-binding cassette domain-containing protein [Treponema sp.]|jgi:zinc transport system ATP-binding protein|nr:ATP-binding cassette domain-containing protein [Treponema sp.]